MNDNACEKDQLSEFLEDLDVVHYMHGCFIQWTKDYPRETFVPFKNENDNWSILHERVVEKGISVPDILVWSLACKHKQVQLLFEEAVGGDLAHELMKSRYFERLMTDLGNLVWFNNHLKINKV